MLNIIEDAFTERHHDVKKTWFAPRNRDRAKTNKQISARIPQLMSECPRHKVMAA